MKSNLWQTSYQWKRRICTKRLWKKAFQNSCFQYPRPQGYLRVTNHPVSLWTCRCSLSPVLLLTPAEPSNIIMTTRFLYNSQTYPQTKAYLQLCYCFHKFSSNFGGSLQGLSFQPLAIHFPLNNSSIIIFNEQKKCRS